MQGGQDYCIQDEVDRVPSLQVGESFEETGRLVDFEGVGSWFAIEGTAAEEACRTLGGLDIHSFQVYNYNWG